MFEPSKTTAIPMNDRVEAPARAGGTDVQEDRARLRAQWGLIALVAALSAGLDAAVYLRLRGSIAGGTARRPIAGRGLGVAHPAGGVASASGRTPSPAPRDPRPGEEGPGGDVGPSHDVQPADDQARRPA